MLVETGTDGLAYRFRWDGAEHARFERAVFLDVLKRHPWRTLSLPFVMAGVAGLSAAVNGGSPPVILGAGVAALVLGVCLRTLLNLIVVPALSSLLYARNHAACLPHDQLRVITPEGLDAACTTSRTFIRWDGIKRVSETSEFFIFYVTRTCAIKLPRRAVGDVAALRARLALVAADGRLRLP